MYVQHGEVWALPTDSELGWLHQWLTVCRSWAVAAPLQCDTSHTAMCACWHSTPCAPMALQDVCSRGVSPVNPVRLAGGAGWLKASWWMLPYVVRVKK